MKSKIEKGTLQYFHEYYDSDKKLSSRWHYDLTKSKNGPIMVEHFNLPSKPKKIKSKI